MRTANRKNLKKTVSKASPSRRSSRGGRSDSRSALWPIIGLVAAMAVTSGIGYWFYGMVARSDFFRIDAKSIEIGFDYGDDGGNAGAPSSVDFRERELELRVRVRKVVDEFISEPGDAERSEHSFLIDKEGLRNKIVGELSEGFGVEDAAVSILMPDRMTVRLKLR